MPIVLLVKDHTVLPHVAVAQSTAAIDWKNVELRTFSTDGAVAEGTFILPGGAVQTLRVDGSRLVSDPLAGRVTWRVTRPNDHAVQGKEHVHSRVETAGLQLVRVAAITCVVRDTRARSIAPATPRGLRRSAPGSAPVRPA